MGHWNRAAIWHEPSLKGIETNTAGAGERACPALHAGSQIPADRNEAPTGKEQVMYKNQIPAEYLNRRALRNLPKQIDSLRADQKKIGRPNLIVKIEAIPAGKISGQTFTHNLKIAA
jgi:hypothetical protein